MNIRARDGMRLALAVAAALVALWIGVRAARPPAPRGLDAPATGFSAARAMRDVRAIAMHPHPVGSVANDKVAAWLLARLQGMGLHAELHQYLADEKTVEKVREWSGGAIMPTELTDVVGLLPGRDPAAPALLLMAHHDTVWGSPGAPDDSAGVAAILEIVRAIRAQGTPYRDVVVLFTDGEETGLAGARAFWQGGALPNHVGVVVNLESRGGGGRATMFETGARAGGMMRLFAASASAPVANSLSAYAYRRMPNNTDFSVPRDRGVAGFNFAFLGRPRYYHSPLATIDRLDPATVQDMGGQALDIAAALAFTRTLPAPADDIVYFDVPGDGLVRYASRSGWLVLIAAGIALAIGLRRARPAGADMLAGVGALLAAGAQAVLLLTALNLLSGSGGAPNYYDRLAALPALEWQASLGALAVAILAFGARRAGGMIGAVAPTIALAFAAVAIGVPARMIVYAAIVGATGALLARRGAGLLGEWAGMLALLLAVGVVIQIAVPLVAWVVAWPVLVLAVVAAFGAPPLLAALGAILVGAPLLPVAHIAFLGLGAPMPVVLLPALLLLIAAFWPLARLPAKHAVVPAILAAVPLIVAAAIAHHVGTDPLARTVPAYSLRR